MSSNVETHKRLTQCFNDRDWAGIEALISPDASFTDHGRGTTLKGAREFMDEMRQWVASFSDARAEQARYLDAGDHTIGLFQARGRNDGEPLPGVAATHKGVDLSTCEVLSYDRDGKVVSGEIFYDSMTMLSQLGIMEPPRMA